MKLACLQENLKKGLDIIKGAVATRSTLPILRNVLLSAENGKLKLVASNLELAITHWLGAKVDEEGDITVPYHMLADFVSTLPLDRIDLALGPMNKMEVRCCRSEAKIAGVAAKGYPPIPCISDGVVAQVEMEALKKGIRRVAFVCADNDLKPILCGAYICLGIDTLTLVGTDGYRLAEQKLAVKNKDNEVTSVIVPSRTLVELSKLLVDEDEPVEMTISRGGDRVLFRIKDTEVLSQVIKGTFPNYEQLIPRDHETRGIIDTNEFLQAVRRAHIFARESSEAGIIRLLITEGKDTMPGKLSVSSKGDEMGEGCSDLDIILEGREGKIAFNGAQLLEFLSIPSERVELRISSSMSPAVFGIVEDESYVYVIMPIFLKDG